MSWALQTLVIALVVMWVIDVPGMLDLGIYTEQFIAATLGGSLALVFLLFPLKRDGGGLAWRLRSEEHTSELQSLMRISYAVFCLKNNTKTQYHTHYHIRKYKNHYSKMIHYERQ